MSEEKIKTTLEKIEGLIVDGQKEVLDRTIKLEEGQKEVLDRTIKLEEGQKEVLDRIIKLEEGQKQLGEGQKEILGVIKEVHSSLKKEIMVTTVAVKEIVKEETKRVEDKLDKHIRQ